MEYGLINTIIASLVTAFIFGVIAKRLNLPALFGYLLAGVAIGPHTPGFIADVSLAKQLAEIGIILLMFGVGLHFSFRDLVKVQRVALPGAIGQMSVATIVGTVVAMYLGYSMTQGMIYGFALSVASTIVLLRSLEQRRMLSSSAGKIAIGWLIIEDIAMVLILVVLPVFADMSEASTSLDGMVIASALLKVMFKVALFFACMILLGRRFLPYLLKEVAKLGSDELCMLAILAIALGFASVAYFVFDASLALGAFLAGMVLNESEIGKRSAEVSVPIRDAFSVLFFVSVGMLFDPVTLFIQPIQVLLTFLTIVVAKTAAAYLITRLLHPADSNAAIVVALGLAQIGEFSFILGGLALSRGLIVHDLYNLILAGAMLSIVANPLLFRLYDFWHRKRLSPQTRIVS